MVSAAGRPFMIVLMAMLLAIQGCGTPEAKKVKISGSITMEKKAITGLPPGVLPLVKFEKSGSSDPIYAKVQASGDFEVLVETGTYKITGSSGLNPLSAPSKKDVVINKEISADTSGLMIDLPK